MYCILTLVSVQGYITPSGQLKTLSTINCIIEVKIMTLSFNDSYDIKRVNSKDSFIPFSRQDCFNSNITYTLL